MHVISEIYTHDSKIGICKKGNNKKRPLKSSNLGKKVQKIHGC